MPASDSEAESCADSDAATSVLVGSSSAQDAVPTSVRLIATNPTTAGNNGFKALSSQYYVVSLFNPTIG